MNVLVIAKKDYREAIRSRVLLGLTLLFALFTTVGAYIVSFIPTLGGPEGAQVEVNLVYGLVAPASILVPIIGLLLGYKAIAGERESGSLNCLLSLPHTRLDVVLGKVVGRTAVVAISIVIGFAAGSIVVMLLSGPFSPVLYLAFIATTIVLGMTFVCLGVGLSAAVTSTSRAAWGAFGVFALFQFLWSFIALLIQYALTGSVIPKPPLPEGYLLFSRLNPQSAYSTVLSSFVPPEQSLNTGSMMTRMTGGNVPVFFNGWFGFGVLVLWAVVPLTLGYLRFRNSELS
ncbi:ABC transporter permease [Haladaptatus sp. DYF46]|uniref:ABC transporter permease n=1 Tax=Haladaptatus sp. DYF46 TaxID=2886041 RepID=UPI001E5F1008|nr:ABC transporter permease [Haladaptatus sp. DYF46]